MRGLRGIGLAAALAASSVVAADVGNAMAMPSTVLGWPSNGPGCAVVRDIPTLPHVWLGHFTGGRLDALPGYPRVLDWQDQFVCFPSRSACQRWQRDMKVHYRRIEGYRTCLPIR